MWKFKKRPSLNAQMRKEKDEKFRQGRRNLIKYSLFTGALLGLPRWKIFETLELAGGQALAQTAACLPTNRSLHLAAGQGGFAWFQLLWPHNDVAAANNDRFAFHAQGQSVLAQGTDRPLTFAPQTPFQDLPASRQISAFMAGNNETHTRSPTSSATIGGNSIYAIAASLQSSNPTVIPAITIGQNAPYGDAPGAPQNSRVGDPDSVVELFNSAASRAGGLLENASDASLYAAHYTALTSLNRASNRPTTRGSYGASQTAADLLGTNLASILAVTDEDLSRYGVNRGTRRVELDIAKTLIIGVKAFQLGLTSSITLEALGDDPHGAFNNMNSLTNTVTNLGAMLDGFMGDLRATPDDSCSGSTLADNFVMTIAGDTPKNPLNRNGWPDGTPGGSNWMYVLGAGHIKTGWHGGIDRDGNVQGFNPATGQNTDNLNRGDTAEATNAAVAYAIAKGDTRRVDEFARGINIDGIVNPVLM